MSKTIDHDTGTVVEDKSVSKKEKSTTGGLLQTIETQLKTEIELFEKLEAEASFRALRIGMLLLRAQAALKRGEFEPWMQKHVTDVRRAQSYYFMGLARTFISQKKLANDHAYLLCEAQPDVKHKGGKTGEVVQLVFDFIQDKSLNDLLDEYGIKKRCDLRRQGGSNALNAWLKQKYPQRRFSPGVTLDQLPMDIIHAWKQHIESTKGERSTARHENLCDTWKDCMATLHRLAIKSHTFEQLTRDEFDLYYGVMLDAKRAMQEFKAKLD